MVAIESLFVRYIKLREKLNNAKIYQIKDNSNNKVYIGSTCDSLNHRLSLHKSHYKRFLKGLCNNIKSFEIIKNNDFKIELLEKCQITTKEELLERERYYIQNNECLNKYIPGRTDKQYKIDNKEKIIIKNKQYYIDNKEKFKQNDKEYREANKDKLNEKFDCECGGKYIYSHKANHIKTAKHQKTLQSLK